MHKAGSLRWRLLWNLALLLVALMLASGWSAYYNGREAADTAYDRTLLASARTIAAGLSQRDGSLSANVPYVALDTFAYDSAGRIYYQVNDIHQQLISGYENLPAPPPGTPRTDDYPALARFYDGQYRGQNVRVVSLLKAVSEPNMNGMAEIRVAETDEARVNMARSLMADTLLRLGMLALGALLLVGFAVSAALRPLERLRGAVEERQPDDLRPLALMEVQDELQPLVRSLNHFTERLRRQFERQGQFIADAAHELRTPLAALKARLELGLRATEPAVWRETLETAAQGTDRLTHLANQLLSLARIENGARAIAEGGAQLLDLSQLARELGMAMAPLAHARGVALALEADEPVWLRGEPTLLNELLSNLVDNALAHTPSGGNVILRVGLPAVLEVEDDGPGIPETERGRVFERFYRRHQQGVGAGLGLAIVGEICRAHLAQISLHDAQPHGLKVRVSFIAGPASSS
ncbi:sensor histidine kinase [Pseudomonas gingeri]|uniref:histidine kinase n=1 Tax=Pseudomonas gingeri TaxID=117681 RepID=A0A7Y7XE61_9PSED|nr:sensor histidine kinase [Pseudomonas gingeri]NWA27108.1 sensor histidine kinase [Pseudomonas gingeri]NWB98195.1 sensor histidine kinase [Pseudomonas gingeri]NWD73050.1 sensor histidine kinase [Pseudomonas gingeri]